MVNLCRSKGKSPASADTDSTNFIPVDKGACSQKIYPCAEIFNEDIPGWSVANDGAFTVALDLEISDDLKREGIAREIVKRIQTYRKESGFEITDHIHVVLENRQEIKVAVEQFKDYICSQVLCDKLEWSDDTLSDKLDFEDFVLNVHIEKFNNLP